MSIFGECCFDCCQTQHIHSQHTGFKHGANFHADQERIWAERKRNYQAQQAELIIPEVEAFLKDEPQPNFKPSLLDSAIKAAEADKNYYLASCLCFIGSLSLSNQPEAKLQLAAEYLARLFDIAYISDVSKSNEEGGTKP